MAEEPTTPQDIRPEQDTIEAIGTSKRRGGKRAKNKIPETVFIVHEVGIAVEPLEPFPVRAKFRNVVGVVAREWVEPTWPDILEEGARCNEEKAKSYALKQLGYAYRQWRTDLMRKYVKNNLTPFEEYGKITQVQWDEFMRQRTIEEAKELSRANTALAKRDVHKTNLGSDGYIVQVKAREVKVPGGQKYFAKPETKEVMSKIRKLAEDQKVDKFVPDREKDVLSEAIGTKELGGQVRGISSKLIWKEGFSEDRAKYKKHDHYKQAMEKLSRRCSWKKMKALAKKIIQDLAVVPGLSIARRPHSADPEGCAVDTVTSLTPCELHIPLGIHGRIEEVARALAILGSCLFHGTPILPNYAMVQVLSVEPKHAEERIDIPTPEGIHFLGQSVNQFILWNKLYILNLAP
ncbi:hypothetical protein BS78_05G076900 [Paspalum vaginatum]|nr:hypothetical protein BS78_05G076900 [Paspalum vaginatum]